MRIVVGSDHAGLKLKTKVREHLEAGGHVVEDVGTYTPERTDYPRYAHRVARAVASGEADRGVAVCGTGQGSCMAVNKFRGVRGALVWDEYTARYSRKHNNSNVLCLGERVLEEELALRLLDIWLETPFDGGRHVKRVEMLDDVDAL